ncbi:putative transcription initiation factor IIE, alpha subunit [Schistosoma mansoni]|uniref:putative transcription initiation factor IIE, alpha subunit n=1 Tax=Schistosoma mansoni TaxID=6183 RepID=UPI00022DCB75|nr:putative transcription initiation factor IIE, alpha subunit [Schistosoma mansoni]|eukprot:XP_018654632.1 putative transcription initiation factor IIE, alpha subunit [Schistosoma mansoni]
MPAINSSVPTPNGAKNIVPDSSPAAVRLPSSSSVRQTADATSNQKDSTKVPLCLIKLVRSIVRTFYSREHSLIVDMLVRNTIMKEDDLCERLRFERKQLRQYLHTLKCDQFIKSKLQLETDVDGKTTKITHYFIDYKVRDPIDLMLRECDEIHLSPAILEPEIRPLEPLNDDTSDESQTSSQNVGRNSILSGDKNNKNSSLFGSTESSVRIVLSGNSRIGDTDSQVNIFSNASEFHANHTPEDAITQTLAPGRVPSGFGSRNNAHKTTLAQPDPLVNTENTSGDLHPKKFEVTVGGQLMLYTDVTPAMVKTMTKEERENYVRVGKLMFTNLMLE